MNLLVSQAKNAIISELKKADFDHDGHPDVLPALHKAEEALHTLIAFAKRLDLKDYTTILHNINSDLGNKFPVAEVDSIAAGLAGIAPVLQVLETVVQGIEKELD